jgi:hypothetical protein
MDARKKKLRSRIDCFNAFAELQWLESPACSILVLESLKEFQCTWRLRGEANLILVVEVKWKPNSCQHSPVPVTLAVKHHHGGANYFFYWRELIEGELAVKALLIVSA